MIILYKSNLTYEMWNFFSLGYSHLFEFTELYIDLKKCSTEEKETQIEICK